MRIILFSLAISMAMLLSMGCKKSGTSTDVTVDTGNTNLKIAYVNGDSILLNFAEFKAQSEAMEARQRKAEEDLQKKGTALEREIMTYQQQAQKGTLTGKEMEAREKYLASRQEAVLAERDKIAKEILNETTVINDRLQKVIHDILNTIKEKEGYDYIFSYIQGGPILVADEKYDITEQVLVELNKTPVTSSETPADSTASE